jgi:serine/threonine protein phosphatase 1
MRRSPHRRVHRRTPLGDALAATRVPTWAGPAALPADGTGLAFVRSPGLLRPDRRIYAVGDIHGCLEKLRALHAAIADDLERRPVGDARLIHLGDYIDTGPDSAGVLELLAGGPPIAGLPTVNLLGDHERTALDALDGDAPSATDWLHDGGAATLRGWSIDPATPRDLWREKVPAAHLAFLRGLALSHRADDYLFVHAGVRPGVSLRQQTADDLVRIRQPFLYSETEFAAVVVHGHTPGPAPVLRQNRICIDTGAAFGGRLTCAVFEADRVGFVSV